MKSNKNKKAVSETYRNQIQVLMSLGKDGSSLQRCLQIEEISEKSGLNDEKETQRCLFILEGQKLVSPQPEGDFTSKSWIITRDGMRALKSIENSIN